MMTTQVARTATDRGDTLLGVLTDGADDYADRIALRDGAGTVLSHRQLWCAARAGADALIARGVRPEDRVGVVAERAAGTVVAILSVLLAGAAYVPVDPAAPQDRRDAILERAAVREVLTGGEPPLPLPAVTAGPAVPVAGPAVPHSLAYVLYTSGSTGVPKGVMVESGSVASFVTAARELFGIGPRDRVLQFSSFAFDTSVFEVFTALAAGAELVIADQRQRADLIALTRLIREHGITVADIPPSVLDLLDPDDVPGLRLVFSGGEPCSAELATKWARSSVAMWHGYGPTETTVAVTAGLADRPRATRMPLGRPVGAAAVHVLDTQLRPVGPGAIGELCVGGAVVGRGYLDAPAATGLVFVPDPHSAVPGARLYRTGDLVRSGPDGEITYLTRRDRQIKVRGVRIEPAEIEDVLRRDLRVRQAVVEGLTVDGREVLAAFVTGSDGLCETDLRRQLAAWFPAWMVPDRVVVLEELPRTINDKTDREALERFLQRLPEPAGGGLASFSELEARVARELFAPAVGRLPERPADDYFGLGGNSLEAIRLLAAVPDLFGVEVPVGDFIADPSVRGLARAIAALRTEQEPGHDD